MSATRARMPELVETVRRAVGAVIDPELRKSLSELDMIEAVTAASDGVRVRVLLTIVACPAADRIEREVLAAAEHALAERASELPVTVELGVMSPAQREALVAKLRAGRDRGNPFTAESLTRVIAVTSGKGGVGKSTLTANLAVALAARGLRVGLIDADVHGFSIPGLLGLGRAKPTRVGELIVPPEAYGVRVISIGMFVDDQATAVAWRGPMLHRTISQFLSDVYFGDLDVLLLDLPPGTGDIAISIGQLLPHAEVLVVTTPQAAAADVAERSGLLARQSGQRLRGVIENMSGFVGPDGARIELFGSGGGQAVAERLSANGAGAAHAEGTPAVPLLGQVPLSVALREGGDDGTPVVLGAPNDPAAVAIEAIAEQLIVRPESLAGRSLPMRPR